MWRTLKLGDVCELVGGGTPSKRNPKFYDGTIPWATVRDMHSEYLDGTECCITEEGLASSSSKVIPSGNVIIASRVGLGKVCLLKHDTAINQDLRGVIPRNGDELDTKYLFYWFKSVAEKIISAGRGATVQGVTLPFLNALELPIPPIAEQQRIVAKLDAAFAEIDRGVDAASNKSVLSLELEKNFLETYFDEEKFESDCVYRLEQVVKFSSGNTPSKKNPDFWEGEFPWISAKDLKAEQIGNSLDKITKYAIETRAAKIAPKGSLLVLVRGMGLLNGIALGELQRDCAFNQDIKALTPDASLNPRFLLLTLKARFLSLDAYLTSAAHGTAKIDFERIKKTKVLVPPLNQQLELVERYDGLVRKCKILLNTAQSTLHQLSMLKSAILTEELQPSEAA
jgi:type I restriction enzyme S subunit